MPFDERGIVTRRIDTALGPMTLAASARGLAGAWFDGQRHHPETARWRQDDAHPVLHAAARQLQQYFAGARRQFALPLDLGRGTPFQQAVWQALLQIEPGSTCSYGSIGARIGHPRALRAVGAAIGRNPVSIIVPCHRVLGSDGTLTGYAGSLQRKAALLALEARGAQAACSR